MQAQVIEISIIIGYVLAVGGLLWTLLSSIQYRITPTHLEVRLLGMALRRIRLDDIKAITTKPVFWAECWSNTLLAQDRRLVIQRYRGFFKHLVITPSYRFVFRADLAEAKRHFAASLADRPVLTLPRPSFVQQIYSINWGALTRKFLPALRKGTKACQVPTSVS